MEDGSKVMTIDPQTALLSFEVVKGELLPENAVRFLTIPLLVIS